MHDIPQRTRRLMIVDDDLMSREVLSLLAAEAGFEVSSFETGEAALESFRESDVPPDAVLADMQMPGISGDSLARLLRSAYGPGTRLLAMSGSAVAAERITAFDGFLRKPFSMDDVCASLNGAARDSEASDTSGGDSDGLNRAIYDAFAQTMPAQQLRQLYTMSLNDADARIETMRKAQAAGDVEAYQRAAHSIKGGCGMVGAVELAHLAAAMEERGPQAVDESAPLNEFLTASARLRRILDALQR